MTVELVLRKLAEGIKLEELLEGYPKITREDVHAAIQFAPTRSRTRKWSFAPPELNVKDPTSALSRVDCSDLDARLRSPHLSKQRTPHGTFTGSRVPSSGPRDISCWDARREGNGYQSSSASRIRILSFGYRDHGMK